MHETAIAGRILQAVQSRMQKLDAGYQAAAVKVVVGEFRNVDPESLQFAFDSLKSAYDQCRQCRLELQLVEAVALCRDNGHEYHPGAGNAFACRQCHSGIGQLLKGEELDIVNIYAAANNYQEGEEHARTN